MRVGAEKVVRWLSVALASSISLGLIDVTNLNAQRIKPKPAGHRCLLEPGPRHTVIGIENSETLRLADGRKVRLLGTLGPRPPLSAQATTRPTTAVWQPEHRAQDALKKLVEGRDVTLAFDRRRRDRYGRWLAHVFVWHNGRRFWVQGELLAHGHARAYVVPGNTACIAELISHETQGRNRGRGLWRHLHFRILKPEPAAWLLGKRRHRFEIISGTVAHVAVVKSKIYLNFGRNWRQDFTAELPKRALLGTRYALSDIIALKGQRVRVRGWIERRNGPYIKLAHPGLIERLAPNASGPDAGADAPPNKSPKRPLRDPPALAGAHENNPIFGPARGPTGPRLTVPRIKRGAKKRPTQKVPDAVNL